MAKDYIIIYVNVWNEEDYKKVLTLSKQYDYEGLKTLMFPEGVISRIEIFRPESEE